MLNVTGFRLGARFQTQTEGVKATLTVMAAEDLQE